MDLFLEAPPPPPLTKGFVENMKPVHGNQSDLQGPHATLKIK